MCNAKSEKDLVAIWALSIFVLFPLLLHDACMIIIMLIRIHEAHMMINCHWFWVCKHANSIKFNGIEQWQFAMNSDNWQIFRIFFNIYLFLILNPMRQYSNIIVRPDENRKITLQWKLVIMKPFSQILCFIFSVFCSFFACLSCLSSERSTRHVLCIPFELDTSTLGTMKKTMIGFVWIGMAKWRTINRRKAKMKMHVMLHVPTDIFTKTNVYEYKNRLLLSLLKQIEEETKNYSKMKWLSQ